ncbi:MAG: efflux RND transporter periplasmic adaptor subunit [Bacteroidetes bacterium]|nr:efflux RND transporter periplasmic adaptor subunit [Bacteroidota bacterium]
MKSIIYISIIAVFLLTACSSKPKVSSTEQPIKTEDQVQLTDAQMKNAGITTGRIEQKEMSEILHLNGKIDVPPQNMVSISVPLGGYLKSTSLLPGMHVKKGQVIAVMEDQQYIQLQQDYLTAKAKLAFLEKEYQRQKDLNQSKASSDKVSQQAEADYRSDRILVTSLSEKLKLIGINPNAINENHFNQSINIYSPIDGFVSKVNINIGKYVAPTEVLFELVNPTDIHLALKVFEKDLDKLYIGQQVVAYTNNQPDKKYDCKVLLIGKDLSADRNTDVHCHFEKFDKSLVPGTYMNAEVKVKNSNARVLPSDAIVQFEGKQFVFKVIDNQRFSMMEINTGQIENGYTQVILPENSDQAKSFFVTKGAYSLLMMIKNKSE